MFDPLVAPQKLHDISTKIAPKTSHNNGFEVRRKLFSFSNLNYLLTRQGSYLIQITKIDRWLIKFALDYFMAHPYSLGFSPAVAL